MKLFAMTGTCALAPHIAFEWAGTDYELKLLKRGEHKSEDYLKINPMGKVPAVVLDDGRVLTEASAILNWIADTHPDAGFGGTDPDTRYAINNWLSFMTTEVHSSAYGPHFAPQRFHPDESQHEVIRATAHKRLRGLYAQMETRLDGRLHPVAGRRTVVEPYLYVLTRWLDLTPISLDDYPGLSAFRESMEADDGVVRALEAQGIKGYATA